MPKPKDDLLTEYAAAADALCNWFISQEISVGRACGIMCFLAGLSIGEASDSEDVMLAGVTRHVGVMMQAARMGLENKRRKGRTK